MNKAGNKILRGAREALKVVQGDLEAIDKIRVTPSCGCVFCDLDLPVHLAQWETNDVARYWHDTKSHRVECGRTAKDAQPRRIPRS